MKGDSMIGNGLYAGDELIAAAPSMFSTVIPPFGEGVMTWRPQACTQPFQDLHRWPATQARCI